MQCITVNSEDILDWLTLLAVGFPFYSRFLYIDFSINPFLRNREVSLILAGTELDTDCPFTPFLPNREVSLILAGTKLDRDCPFTPFLPNRQVSLILAGTKLDTDCPF